MKWINLILYYKLLLLTVYSIYVLNHVLKNKSQPNAVEISLMSEAKTTSYDSNNLLFNSIQLFY